ncbi:PREDICTED: interferon-induced protein with tetratricopeptide repeats 1-like [Nanorana parkeri]|uniref:interferon-induced protein with tetratricopeptide repeats 1-like n=1 Tax=Nanorana parkeri TaxID=125878 RepID=UPI000854B78B|nr:PREDICTED: interferon-induced protein with tetratricopeptide repeats 1-like [Nanorana parkeri]
MNSLKSRIEKLQCHFTWNLLDEEVHLDNIKGRLKTQVEFLSASSKCRLYNILAYASYLSEDHEEATDYLLKAEEQLQDTETEDNEAKRIIIYANYAWIFYHRNHTTKVYKYLKKVKEISNKFESPPLQNVLLFEMYSEKGFSLLSFHGRHSERAKDCFEKALDLDRENPELNSSYAIAVYKLEGPNCLTKPLHESFPLLKRAAELNPKDTMVKVLLGLKYQDQKNSKAGLIHIEEALRGTPEFPFLLRYVGKFYRRAEMIDEAILVLSEATRLNPTSCHLHYQLSLCYKKRITTLKKSARKAKLKFQSTRGYTENISKAVSSAILHLETATKYRKTFVSAYLALAFMYGRAEQYQKADEIYHQVLNMDNLTEEEKQKLHLMWAQYELYKRNCQSEAIKHYKEAVQIQCPTVYRKYAIQDCKALAEDILTRIEFDDTGIDLLDFIHEQDGNVPESDMNCTTLELDSDSEE